MPEYKWKPIDDIPEELYSYSDPDLRALENEWQEVRARTSDEVLDKILTEIKREWAIETGKIEGLYTLSKGITKTLIQYGISARLIPQDSTNIGPLHLAELLQDQQEVIEGLMDYVAQSKSLTLHYIRQMHQVFTRHQDTTEGVTEDGKPVYISLLKGDWKKWPNNPLQRDKTIHEYCPPEQVPNEMERLLALHQKHLEKGVSPEVEAAFLHHRFTQIHPFQDGNGRVARALASLVFLRQGDFSFVVQDEEREDYIIALEEADNKTITKLIDFMIEKQKELLFNAIREAQRIGFDDSLHSISEKPQEYYRSLKEKEERFTLANKMVTDWLAIAMEILEKTKTSLNAIETLKEPLGHYFNFLDFEGVNKNISLPEATNFLHEGKCFTVTIQYLKKNEDIRLFIGSLGTGEEPEQIYADLTYFLSHYIDSFIYDIEKDKRIGNLRFREWFQNNMTKLINRWMS
jgi:Fic family protein